MAATIMNNPAAPTATRRQGIAIRRGGLAAVVSPGDGSATAFDAMPRVGSGTTERTRCRVRWIEWL
jgi:hypothetical protein